MQRPESGGVLAACRVLVVDFTAVKRRFVMKKLFGLSCLTAMLVCACTANNVIMSRIPFPEAEYLRFQAPGSGVVRGKVYIMAQGGDAVVAQRNRVILNPVTSYSLQWYEEARLKHPMEDPDPRLRRYVREVIADADGRFEFTNVPAGDYYLSAPLAWEAPWPVHRNSSVMPQGGFIVRKVAVHEGDTVEVSLTYHVRLPDDELHIIQSDSDKSPIWTATEF